MQKREKMMNGVEEDEEEQQKHQHQTAVLEQVFGHFSSDDDNQE
jgi:hypothetical protein